MDKELLNLLKVPSDRLDSINKVLLDPNELVISDFLKVVEKYGSPEEINRRHAESRQLPNLLKKVEAKAPDYLKDLEWLMMAARPGSLYSGGRLPAQDTRRTARIK